MLLEAYSPGLGTKGSLGCDLKLLRIDGCPFNQRAVGHPPLHSPLKISHLHVPPFWPVSL